MDSTYILFVVMMVLSILAVATPVAGGVFYLVRHRVRGMQRTFGLFLVILGISIFLLNPFTNVSTSLAIDRRSLSRVESQCVGYPVERMYELCGKPDYVWTNSFGTFVMYSETSPFWSYWKQDTVAGVSNGVIVKLWQKD